MDVIFAKIETLSIESKPSQRDCILFLGTSFGEVFASKVIQKRKNDNIEIELQILKEWKFNSPVTSIVLIDFSNNFLANLV